MKLGIRMDMTDYIGQNYWHDSYKQRYECIYHETLSDCQISSELRISVIFGLKCIEFESY